MREVERSRKERVIEKGGQVIGEALETNHSFGYVGKPVLIRGGVDSHVGKPLLNRGEVRFPRREA